MRFYSFDEKAYFNENAVEYVKYIERNEKKKDFHKKTLYDSSLKSSLSSNNSQSVENILLKIESTGVDITGSYNQWFQIGCALANEFGEDGREMFHRVSQYSDKYIDTITDVQFDKCLVNKYSYKIGTFFHHAEECFKGVQ